MADSLTQTPPPVSAPRSSRTSARPRRRLLKVTGALFVLLALAVGFAPAIVAKTSLLNRIARTATADLNGTLDIGSASLGWFWPVELRDVTLTDSQGRVVASVPKVTSGHTLFALVRNRSELGEFTLDHPTVEIVCEKDTTNLEDVLQKLLADDTPTGPARPQITVRVIEGTLTLREANTTGEFRDIDATVSVPASRSEPVAVNVTANAPGRVAADLSIGEVGRAKLNASGLALESLAPLVRRFQPQLTLTGSLTTDVVATWGNDSASIDGTLGVKNLALAAPGLNGDTLRLASAELPLKVAVLGRTVRVERCELTTDIGSASLLGTFDPNESLDSLLDKPGVKLDATVDLARLAAALPKLLRIRDGTELREGKLVAKVESTSTPGGTAWTGDLRTSSLKAIRDGKEVRWDEPLSVEFAGRVKVGQFPTFDKLVCKSDFIALNAEVKPDSVRAAANVFLDKLAARLADFVDLGGVALDGQGSAWVIASRTPTNDFKANAQVELKQFAVVDRAGNGLREPSLKLQLSATGTAPDAGPVSISSATLALTAGTDELHLKLLGPIPDARRLTGGELDALLSGDLGRWRTRLAAVVPIPEDYTMGGTAAAHGVVRLGPDGVKVNRLSLSVDNARFVGAGIDLDEPNVSATADLTVDRKAGTTTFDDFTINSAPLSVTRGKLAIHAPPGGQLVVTGEGPAVANLNRLGKVVGMYADRRGPTAFYGTGKGPIRFRYAGDVTTFGGALDVADFAIGPKNQPEWAEPNLRVELDAAYTRSTNSVAFTAARVERPGLALALSGRIDKLDTTTDANLSGTMAYDMAKLTPRLREMLGGDFTAKGTGSKPVSFAGSLRPPSGRGAKTPPNPYAALTAELALGWDSVTAYGFEMGTGEVRGQLADGVAKVSPINATFGGGKVTVKPTVRLDPLPGEVTLAKGLMVDKAKLTPKACASALGYALPAIANSSQAAGEISFQLDEGKVPFADPQKAHIRGSLMIHKATVTAGPVLGAIAKILGAENATMTLANDQTVPVRVENGRVFHENLSVKVGGYVVHTTGSVGFDGTLSLTADVPIPGGLPGLKNAPAVAKALAGKRVSVPIRGTLNAPALDPKQFQAAVTQLARSAAKDVGKDLLNKELDKLFPGGPNPGGLFPFPLPKK